MNIISPTSTNSVLRKEEDAEQRRKYNRTIILIDQTGEETTSGRAEKKGGQSHWWNSEIEWQTTLTHLPVPAAVKLMKRPRRIDFIL